MPNLSNVVSTFRRRLNSTSGGPKPDHLENNHSNSPADHSTPSIEEDHQQLHDLTSRNSKNILKSLPRPRRKSTRKKLDPLPPLPPLSDTEDEPPELRRWSGFKDPFPRVQPGGYKRYYETHGGVPEPKLNDKPLPPKPTISQPMLKQSNSSRSGKSSSRSSSTGSPHASPTSPSSPSRNVLPRATFTGQDGHDYQYPTTTATADLSPNDLDHQEPDDLSASYTSPVLPYDPPAHNYQKKRLSTIQERPSRPTSRISTVSQVSVTGTVGTTTAGGGGGAGTRSRTNSGATQHSHTRTASTGSNGANSVSSVHTSASVRLRRRQRQVLRTPSIVKDFNAPGAENDPALQAISQIQAQAQSLHRGPSTSSNSSALSYSNLSSSSISHRSHSRVGSGSDTPPTTVEGGSDEDKDGAGDAEERGDVFDEGGLEAVARSAALKRRVAKAQAMNKVLSKGKGRADGYAPGGALGVTLREKAKRRLEEQDGWEDEQEEEGKEDWRNTWYTAKTHFSDDGR